MALIEFKNVNKYYGDYHALRDINLEIEKGQVVVLLGPSGSGKSTLIRTINALESIDNGTLIVNGHNVTEASAKDLVELRKEAGMVFQHFNLYPHKTVLENVTLAPIKVLGISKADAEKTAEKFLRYVNMWDKKDSYPGMLSGGQKQRIAIARGLMLDPDVVIADEPVSALDVSVRAQVLNLMMDLQQELGLSYVFISHDLSVVEHIADEVMVMYLGRCVEKGTKDQIFNNPRHPYTQALLSATPRLNPDDRRERIKLSGELPSPLNPPPGCAFNARCRRRFGPCTQLQPQLKDYGGQLVACFAVDQDENPQR